MLHYIFFLFPTMCCLFWATVLPFRWRTLPLSSRIGTIALCLMGIGISIRLSSLFDPYEDGLYLWDVVESFCTLSFFSCLILYFRTLTNDKAVGWKSAWVFLPGLLLSGILFCLYFLSGRETMDVFIREMVHRYYIDRTFPDPFCWGYFMIHYYIYRIVILILACCVLVYGGVSLKRYKALNPGLLYVFLLGVIFFAVLLLVWYQIAYFKNPLFIGSCMFVWGSALYLFGLHLIHTGNAVEPIDNKTEERQPQDPTEEHTEEEIWQKIREKLQPTLYQLMEEEMIFRQPDLHLEELALRAHTNRTYLSRLIKEDYGYGFPEYIARRRIEYACEQIRENPSLTLEQLAEQSGFSYGTAFSRAFKQYTGITFREWKRMK
ncbi:helix-turn-helix domain-containing protein [Parabacteroides sp. PF5-6]|uniref:helix-turn-helix domain-containing protein n=1 Tax=Parabacteroides sp. PF5-6 TaxID=1742403 RepID=UPI00240610BB|nr:helix-turn-helix domain-containing protein [Parabacteroides sp. PF5-6]MDF9829852.1 AraC-like DNA-binding protein [Parabacteroides sp. PF5-6]